MKSVQKSAAVSQAASVKSAQPARTNSNKGAMNVTEAAAQGARGNLAESCDFTRTLESWWDWIFHFFARHRATTALVAWAGVYVFDVVDMCMPAEWLVFTFFSFSVFVQAFGMSILLFAALTVAMFGLNVAVYYFLPFAVTSLLSTVVVSMLLVRGVHGLDSRGWSVTVLMSLSRISTPWCKILPEYLQAPVAAYCASFGLLWIVYHSSGRLERLLDPLCMILGVIPPLSPRLSIVEIVDTSIVVSWTNDFSDGCLLTTTSRATNGPSGASTSSAAYTSDAGSLSIRASQSSSNLLVGDALEQPLSPLVTPANEKPLISAASYTASASDTTLRIGGYITVDRKQLPEARVQSYEVEVNGRIVGKCGREDETTRIQGLLPLMTYQIRIWAISNSRGRTPSAPVFVKTLTSCEALAQDSRTLGQSSLSGSEPVSVDGLHRETIDLQRETGEMEDAMSDLKDQTDLECGKLQVKVSKLRATRKEDESTRAVQRSRLRELEAEKRWLEKEKSELVSKIAESAARKQRALDRRRDKAKKAEEYRRMTDLIYEKMERERCDYENEQSELVATIDALKLEVDKANQHMHELLQEQADVASQLQSRRAELTAQDEENAELDSKIKTAIHKQRQIKAGQKEAAMTIAKLQTEVDSLKFQLDEAVSQRQQFEILAAEARQSLPYTAATVARPPPIHPASYGLSAAKQHSMVGSGSTHSTVFSQSSLPARIRNVEYPVIGNYDNGLSNNHTRSLSSIGILQCASIAENPLPLAHSRCPDQSSSGKHSVNSANAFLGGTRTGYSGASLRDSTDIGDLLSGWSSSVPKLTTELSSASGYIHPLHFGQSNASDTQPLLASSDIIRALSQPTEAGLASSTGGGSSAEFTGHSNPIMINRDIPGHARHASFWRSQSCAPELSTSTTMAEASALSILKDTDLAYPMPQKPAYGAPRLFSASNAFAGSGIWADSSHEFQPLSVGSDVTADYKSGRNSTEVDCNAAVPFLLRTASPAEQPQALFSSDVLGVHSFSGVGAAPTLHRSFVDPIGAPARRHRGPSFGALSTRSHDHLPLSESIQHLDQNSSLPQSTGSRSCRTSMDHKIVSSPPTDKSLFQRRSFWEQDSADLHK